MKTSKWFRVATEGATTDGRAISRDWISQMARNFNPQKYGARIWMDEYEGTSHFRATASECQDWRAEKSICNHCVEGEVP